MTVKDINELAGEEYLSSSDVDARIAELANGNHDLWREDAREEARAELAELTAFRDEVTGYTGPARWNNGMTLIADRKWDEWAEDEAENLYGREAVQSRYFQLDRFALDLQSEDYQMATLNGYPFWYPNG